jgi:hypothetical protein
MEKTIVIIGMVIGSYAGSCVPLLWGESLLSMSSIILGGVGGLAGIFVAYKISRRI